MKETYYFPHEFNSINDIKIVAMLSDYGGAGYGYFWAIIELLHTEETHKLPLKKYIYLALAKQMVTNAEQIEKFIHSCINDYELFKTDGTFFWSERVLRNIEVRKGISLKRSEAGKLGANAKQTQANAKQNVAKEKKEKEIKEKEKETTNPTETSSVVKVPNIIGAVNFDTEPQDFTTFWDLYDKKVDKHKCLLKWRRITAKEKELIFINVPLYIKSLSELRYQKNPLTYLNGRCWEDVVKEEPKPLSALELIKQQNPYPQRGTFTFTPAQVEQQRKLKAEMDAID